MDLKAQASQAAQQGQQLLANDQAQSSAASSAYDASNAAATDANKNLQDQATYMQGAGSGQSVYNSELGTLESSAGYNPQQLSDANKSLFSLTGALNGANTQMNTAGGVGAYGMSAPALASYEGSILNPLQTGVANANTQVGALNSELGTFETGANQATSNQVQGEQATITALSSAVTNYQAQAAQHLQTMQFYSQLAQQQGGLNAQQQQAYAQSAQLYAAASQANAQAKLLLSQTTGQNITNQGLINQLPDGTSIGGLTSSAPSAPTVNGSSSSPFGSYSGPTSTQSDGRGGTITTANF